MDIHFGTSSEFIRIVLPESYSTDGWVQAEVEISVPGFIGKISPSVEAEDFRNFTHQLRNLYDTLSGQAEFEPREKQFVLLVKAGTLGHVSILGDAWTNATYGSHLEFELELDQSYLSAPLIVLEDLINEA
jgi:hypothetical protein